MIVWLTGLSGAGKTTLGHELARQWRRHAPNVVFLDEDELHCALGPMPGGDPHALEGRRLQAERMTSICQVLDRQGIHVVCAHLSIFPDLPAVHRALYSSYLLVHVSTPLDVCMRRDPDDLYLPALVGMRRNVVGIDIDYQPPQHPDLVVDNGTDQADPHALARELLARVLQGPTAEQRHQDIIEEGAVCA